MAKSPEEAEYAARLAEELRAAKEEADRRAAEKWAARQAEESG